MESIIDYFYGPRLISMPKEFKYYKTNFLESFGYMAISTLNMLKHFTFYASPLLTIYIYKNGYYKEEYLQSYIKLCFFYCTLFLIGNLIKGFGRLANDDYLRFLKDYRHINQKQLDKKEFLNMYDFDISLWKPDFINVTKSLENINQKNYYDHLSYLRRLFFDIFSFCATHSFALKMAYPGSSTLMNYMLYNSLNEGRFNLLTRHKAQRAKLETYYGLYVDTIFIDKRNVGANLNKEPANNKPLIGDFLLITCEGNASFYEIGCSTAFIRSGLSILGWNHPGFACSTGKPYPENEIASIDTVVQYALIKLQFSEEKIIFYSWSIGCFSASWASLRYPKNTALILDAAFDDILPLAIKRMPESIESLVTYTVRRYFDLRTLQYLTKNPSLNVIFIRRTEDEIMNIKEGDISSNRINRLALKTFQKRYPFLFTPDILRTVKSVLKKRITIKDDLEYSDDIDVDDNSEEIELSDSECFKHSTNGTLEAIKNEDLLETPPILDVQDINESEDEIRRENQETFPFILGKDLTNEEKLKTALKMVKDHFYDFEGSHCDPLPHYFFTDVVSKFWKRDL